VDPAQRHAYVRDPATQAPIDPSKIQVVELRTKVTKNTWRRTQGSPPETLAWGGSAVTPDAAKQRKIDERRSFLFLTVVMVPALMVMLVAGYGFVVWMYQLIAGPPTG
jgi:nitrate reductase NapE